MGPADNLLTCRLLQFDNLLFQSFNKHYFIGIDEVGRGALAGPVIACAYSFKITETNHPLLATVNDSKQLRKKEREKLYALLTRVGNYSLGYASVLEIEKLNILNATFLAMKRAFDGLILKTNGKKTEPYILIDGNKFNPYINARQLPIVDGDTKSFLIASASIIAKVYRDKLMNKVSRCSKFKRFGWRTNVGYGTPFHREAILKRGLTPLHRKLFVRKVIQEKDKIS